MANQNPDRLFDLRTVTRHIRANLLSRSTYTEFLESLPDMVENVRAPEENSDNDPFETMSSPPQSTEDDEAGVVLDDSTAPLQPQVSSTVPAPPEAPVAPMTLEAVLQPQASSTVPAAPEAPVAPMILEAVLQPQASPTVPAPPEAPVTPMTPEAAPLQPQTASEPATESVPLSPSIEPDLPNEGDPFADAPLPGQMRIPPVIPGPPTPASSDDREPDDD